MISKRKIWSCGILWLFVLITGFAAVKKTNEGWIDANGFSALSKALEAAKGKTLVISKTLKMGKPLTVPEDTHLLFLKNGVIVGTQFSRLHVKGKLTAPLTQIFSGFKNGSVVFEQGTVVEAYPQWWGAKCNKDIDSSYAIECAVNSKVGIVRIPQGHYFLKKTLNLTNNIGGLLIKGSGSGQGGGGTVLVGETGGIAVDTTGSCHLDLRDLRIISGKNTPSTIGILYARSVKNNYAEFNSLRNVTISIAPNRKANNGNGTVAVYDHAAELWRGRDLYLEADNAIVFTGYNIFNIKSVYAKTLTTISSMSVCVIDGTSTLRGAHGPCVTLDNATRIEILNAYYCGNRQVKNPFPYAVKIRKRGYFSYAITITGHKERLGGWLYSNVVVRNLKLEGTGMGHGGEPVIRLEPPHGAILNGKISVDPMTFKDMALIDAPGTATIANMRITLFDKQKIAAPKARFSGNIIQTFRSIKNAEAAIKVSPKASYILMAKDEIAIKGSKK